MYSFLGHIFLPVFSCFNLFLCRSVLKTFSFQNTSLLPRLFAILIGSGGETINKLVESLKKVSRKQQNNLDFDLMFFIPEH